MKKKGITLITITISITILAFIAGAVIFNTVNLVGKTQLSKFSEELELIEDKIEEYYVLNGVYPVLTETTYSSTQIAMINTNGKSEMLTEEIKKNHDENSTFYLIDYERIQVKLLERGLKVTPDDIYVVAKETNTVYYLKGVEIEEKVYFSLINITNAKKFN